MADGNLTAQGSDAASSDLRLLMINSQLRTTDVSDAAVLAAFLAVPRERFASAATPALAYLDRDAPALGAKDRKLLAPRTLGRLLQAAEPKRGERALDVGGGSGYSAALLAALGCDVTALESDVGAVAAARDALGDTPEVAVVLGDLATGGPQGPFDVILINGAFEAFPHALVDRLAEGGRLVGLDGSSGSQRGVLIEKSGASYSEMSLFDAKAEVLPGLNRAPSFAF